MKLPRDVRFCMDRLEAAGYAVYAVGGCVRDACLGREPHDYDLCTAALPEQTEAVFADHSLVLAGKKHGTVGVVTSSGVIEITTFRTEGGYEDHRHPQWVRFVPSIEEDLARRDFTVNAMAWSPVRGFADPFGGQKDLAQKCLRAVGDPEKRFQEDALRILRGVRFSARYGLTPEPKTLEAMVGLAPLMEDLARERVFDELCKLLLCAGAVDLIRFSGILAAAIPELGPMIGFDQRCPHHAYDVFTHSAYVTAALPAELTLRWAGLLHDVGKVPSFTLDSTGRGHFYDHARIGAAMADGILRRLKAPTALREQVVQLITLHMTPLLPDKKLLRRRLSKLGREGLEKLLALQQADLAGKGVPSDREPGYFEEIGRLLQELDAENACFRLKDLAVNGHDLVALGAAGPAVGRCLQTLLEQVMEEILPNEHTALLDAAAALLAAERK